MVQIRWACETYTKSSQQKGAICISDHIFGTQEPPRSKEATSSKQGGDIQHNALPQGPHPDQQRRQQPPRTTTQGGDFYFTSPYFVLEKPPYMELGGASSTIPRPALPLNAQRNGHRALSLQGTRRGTDYNSSPALPSAT